MKVLYGVTLMGSAKSYIIPKWLEMHRACIAPHADTLIVGDKELIGIPHQYCTAREVRPWFAEDMLWTGDLMLRRYALENGYDYMLPAGIDQLYDKTDDFARHVRTISLREYDAVGTLQVARTDSSYAVCRRFVDDEGRQEDVPESELLSGELIDTGFPGFDTCVLSRRALEMPWWDEDESGGFAWYERVDLGMVNICAQEWLVLKMLEHGMRVGCDTSIKTWHVHEDMIARMWKGVERNVQELSW